MRAVPRRFSWSRVVVNVGLFGMIPLFVLAAVVVAVGQRGMVMGMGVPRGSMLVVVADPTGMVVADMPMVVAMLGCRMGVLGLLAFSSVRCRPQSS